MMLNKESIDQERDTMPANTPNNFSPCPDTKHFMFTKIGCQNCRDVAELVYLERRFTRKAYFS